MGRENETWQVVFTCAAIREKEVWYVSSWAKANACARQHMDSIPGRKRMIYDQHETKVTIKQLWITEYTS